MGVTLTSMSDLARLVGTHGLRATMREGLPELVKGIRGISPSIAEAKELGAVTEVILNSRLASLAELNDPYAYGSAYERMMDNATRTFTKLTGLGYWNDAMKSIVSVMAQNRIIRNTLKNFDDLDRYERAWMAYLGIDEIMSGRIFRQYKQYGHKDGVAYVANTARWHDKEASRVFAAALNKDTDRAIVTKGVADQPLFTRSNLGRLVFQFKSFALASHQRVLLAGLQERPHRFAEMLVGATVIGMMVAWLKHMERGDTERANALFDNPGLWVSDGLDRTGIFSVVFETSNTMDKLNLDEGFGTGVPLTIKGVAQSIAGDKRRDLDVSRYSMRGPYGAVLGPSASIFEDLQMFTSQMMDGDLRRSGASAALRQLPYGTLPGVRTGLYVGVRPMLNDVVE